MTLCIHFSLYCYVWMLHVKWDIKPLTKREWCPFLLWWCVLSQDWCLTSWNYLCIEHPTGMVFVLQGKADLVKWLLILACLAPDGCRFSSTIRFNSWRQGLSFSSVRTNTSRWRQQFSSCSHRHCSRFYVPLLLRLLVRALVKGDNNAIMPALWCWYL